MKIQIKNRFSGAIIFEHDVDSNSRKLTVELAVKNECDLRGSDLRGSDLRGSDLRGSDLRGSDFSKIKNYSESHDVFMELIKKLTVDSFTEKEWSIIGMITIHRLCWDSIEKRFGKDLLPILKKLADKGFGEYLKRYEEVLKE